jgi:hypothetical protein
MKDQHTKITGYRDLSQAEIDLMNEIKAKASELDTLYAKVVDTVKPAWTGSDCYRWAAIGKTDLQTGIMALVRAVAQPTTF